MGKHVNVSLTTAVATLFKTAPNTRLDGDMISSYGGRYAWRTRVAECRTKLGMDIENILTRKNGYTISEYVYHVPAREGVTRRPARNQHTGPREVSVGG